MLKRFIFASTALVLSTQIAMAGGYKEIEVKDGGTIEGTVHYEGKAPPAKTVTQDTNVCGSSTPDVALQVKDGKLQYAVVFLKKVKEGKAFAKEHGSATSDQKKCVFVPHVTLVKEGGEVEFKNSDSVLHNVKANSIRNGQFNEGVEAGKSIKKKFEKGHDAVKVSCSVHPFMASWIVVMPHPYYAVTGEDGSFKLTDVPAGKYKVIVWHPTKDKACTVSVDGGAGKKQSKSGTKVKLAKKGTIKIKAVYKG